MAEPTQTLNRITLIGRLHKLIYPKGQEEDGGFAVFVLAYDSLDGEIDSHITDDEWYRKGQIKLIGKVPQLALCTDYHVTAVLNCHPKYGWAYKVETIGIYADFTSIEGQRKFLSYVLTPPQIDTLYTHFDNPIELLKTENIPALCTIKGIGDKLARKLIQKYKENSAFANAYAFLYDYGATGNLAWKIIKHFQDTNRMMKEMSTNPYCLIDEVPGIGWVKADKMALTKGIARDNPYRLAAFTRYYLEGLADTDGHTWVTADALIANLSGLVMGLSREKALKCIEAMVDSKLLYYDKDTNKISLYTYRLLEEKIYLELMRLMDAQTELPIVSDQRAEEIIKQCEAEVGFRYSDEQRAIIDQIVHNKVFLLTGKAGSGKTSLMYPVSKIFAQSGLSIELCALSGKASLNLAQTTGVDGKTIHRLLQKGQDCEYNHNNQLPTDVIIVDELSMVGGELFYSLIQAIKTGAKLIMLGDPGQLEAIGLCNLISDIRSCDVIPQAYLTKIFRQAARSGIILDSYKIYEQMPLLSKDDGDDIVHGELKDMDIRLRDDSERCVDEVVKIFRELYYRRHVGISDILIVTARRESGVLSMNSLNKTIQGLLKFPERPTMSYGKGENAVTYHVGDRILVTQNNYHVKNYDCPKKETQVFNGNIGTVVQIVPDKKSMVVKFPAVTVWVTDDMLPTITLGYAITAHKGQGSGFPYVITTFDGAAHVMLTKEWLYTAITRAKTHCYVVASAKHINQCIANTKVAMKQTWLSYFLCGYENVRLAYELSAKEIDTVLRTIKSP